MQFYESIAQYYEFIFPYSHSIKDFVLSTLPSPCSDKSLLDIGCGIGDLTSALSEECSVTGVDIDAKMVEIAQSRHTGVEFEHLDMLDIESLFGKNVFDTVLSFGNTLVHLPNLDDMSYFLSQVSDVLKPGGKLLLQIINYDHIIDNKITELPLIDNEHVRFERRYNYLPGLNRIEFVAELTVKTTDKKTENRITLYPLRKAELEKLLLKAGFKNLSFYGDFAKGALRNDSLPLIVEAQ